MIVDTNKFYTHGSLFVMFETGTLLIKVHPEFLSVIKAAVIIDDNLDYCQLTDNISHFCNICYGMIVEKQISKLGFANCGNLLAC